MERRAHVFFLTVFLFLCCLSSCLRYGLAASSSFHLVQSQRDVMNDISKIVPPTSTNGMWNATTDPCYWVGVSCSNPPSPVVTSLSLSGFGLSTINTSLVSRFFDLICRLDHLKSLDLSGNSLTTIPGSFFSNCSGLSGFLSELFSSVSNSFTKFPLRRPQPLLRLWWPRSSFHSASSRLPDSPRRPQLHVASYSCVSANSSGPLFPRTASGGPPLPWSHVGFGHRLRLHLERLAARQLLRTSPSSGLHIGLFWIHRLGLGRPCPRRPWPRPHSAREICQPVLVFILTAATFPLSSSPRLGGWPLPSLRLQHGPPDLGSNIMDGPAFAPARWMAPAFASAPCMDALLSALTSSWMAPAFALAPAWTP